jgi:hypothetical protein
VALFKVVRYVIELPGRSLVAHDGYLYVLSAMRTRKIESNKLTHHPLGNSGNHRVYVIQAIIQHIQPLLEKLYLPFHFGEIGFVQVTIPRVCKSVSL